MSYRCVRCGGRGNSPRVIETLHLARIPYGTLRLTCALLGTIVTAMMISRFVRLALLDSIIDHTGSVALKLIALGEWRSARCVFHDDARPSLRVRVESGTHRCMACGPKRGDVIDFHRMCYGLSFPHAARAPPLPAPEEASYMNLHYFQEHELVHVLELDYERTAMKAKKLFDSKYVAKEDVEYEPTWTITGIEQRNVVTEGKSETKWVVIFDESEKPLIMNHGHKQDLIDWFGDETDEWIGRKVTLYVDRNVIFQGKRVGGIRLKRVTAALARPGRADVNKQLDEAANDAE